MTLWGSQVQTLYRAPSFIWVESDGGWIYIVPKGELPNSGASIVQVLDDKSMNSILANIEKARNKMGAKWPGIYAGREHFIYNEDKDWKHWHGLKILKSGPMEFGQVRPDLLTLAAMPYATSVTNLHRLSRTEVIWKNWTGTVIGFWQ